jgi:alkanesulfonate monooxygenase SsuD/methylene tetrahydromethanopterin reductase-like flavin-dependent oxidoreductase (luciferase family)
MSTLQKLSGGRMVLGAATGGSTIMALGRPQAHIAQMRGYILAHRALFRGESIEWEGKHIHNLRYHENVPIYYSAFGPKGLQLAGELCDGVILFTGSNLGPLQQKIAAVRSAAAAAGRDPQEVDIWVCSFCAVRPTRAEAVQDIKGFLPSVGMSIAWTKEVLETVPQEVRGKLAELGRRYDPGEHVTVGGKNSTLVDELGLAEYLSHFDTIVGPPQQVGATLEQIAALGVSTFFAALPGNADRSGTLRRLADIAGLNKQG